MRWFFSHLPTKSTITKALSKSQLISNKSHIITWQFHYSPEGCTHPLDCPSIPQSAHFFFVRKKNSKFHFTAKPTQWPPHQDISSLYLWRGHHFPQKFRHPFRPMMTAESDVEKKNEFSKIIGPKPHQYGAPESDTFCRTTFFYI